MRRVDDRIEAIERRDRAWWAKVQGKGQGLSNAARAARDRHLLLGLLRANGWAGAATEDRTRARKAPARRPVR